MKIEFTAHLDGSRDMTVSLPENWWTWDSGQRYAWLNGKKALLTEHLVQDSLEIGIQADGEDADEAILAEAGSEQELREVLIDWD